MYSTYDEKYAYLMILQCENIPRQKRQNVPHHDTRYIYNIYMLYILYGMCLLAMNESGELPGSAKSGCVR